MSVIYFGRRAFKRVLNPFFEELSNNIGRDVLITSVMTKQEFNQFKNLNRKADFFITGENLEPNFKLADKQIGFWCNCNDKMFRFPNWMWHLDWPEIKDNSLSTNRYGESLKIEKLENSINQNYNNIRQTKAAFFTNHFKKLRKELYNIVNSVLECDGYGRAFDNVVNLKKPILEKYCFCLCPENDIGDGYITEKIPDAFYAGCIPITYCNPKDLELDFNKNAVVNLFGLSKYDMIKKLKIIKEDNAYLKDIPLLKNKLNLKDIREFIIGDT
jgi:hypothetical protein